MGLKALHFHDLRHAGNTWAAKAGTPTKDLMTRMGHDDMRAALICQHVPGVALPTGCPISVESLVS